MKWPCQTITAWLYSRRPGHLEHSIAPGVEATTGPLGQGCGMSVAERRAEENFNRPGLEIVDYDVYAFCSDGDMMEGVSNEAASLAGHLRLSNLCWISDDNQVNIEGRTQLAFGDDVGMRFRAYGWPEDESFLLPDGVREYFHDVVDRRGGELRRDWLERMLGYREAYPDLASRLDLMQSGETPEGWDSDPPSSAPDPNGLATRDSWGKALNAIAAKFPWLVGGAAELAREIQAAPA
nr:hypothetical protein [Rhodoblastus sphagnicola]